MTQQTDRIERQIHIKAKRSRVWRALTNAQELSQWFKVDFANDAQFAVGRKLAARNAYPGYEHMKFDIWIETMEAEHTFAWRWHPFPVDQSIDYSKEPTTLVEFKLQDTDDGTLLKVVESGFDGIPASRRAEAYRMHQGGWEEQLQNVARHSTAS